MPNSIATADLVNQCVEGLIAEKGLDKLSDEKHRKLHDILAGQLMSQINTAILYSLPDDKFDEIEKMADGEEIDPDKLQEVVASADIEYSGLVEKVIEKFREAFLSLDIKEEA